MGTGITTYRHDYCRGHHWFDNSQTDLETDSRRSPTPWEVQALIIWTLDIGEDPYDPGYVTPYSWVCKDWCREIRKRIYRRCNLKRIETANWFLLSIYDSAVSFRGSPGMGSLITTVSFSFIPALNGMESFCHDYSDSFTQYDYDFDPCKTKEDNRSFWDRLKEAAKYMVSLETLYLCYGTNSLDVTIFALYSQCASAFPSSLKTLILRPQQVQWPLVEFTPQRASFNAALTQWRSVTLIYLEFPGYVIYPPTRAELDRFVAGFPDNFSDTLEKFVIRCGYGRELEPDDEVDPELLPSWVHGMEGIDDYFLPKPLDYGGHHNQSGGVYEIGRKECGGWEGGAGSVPAEYTWIDNKATFF